MIPRGGGPGTPGAPDSPVVTILNSAVCFIAAPAAAVTVVSWLLTFTPWARFMPDAFFVPLFFLTFPLFGWSVFILSVVRRRPGSPRQAANPLKEIPRGDRNTRHLVISPESSKAATRVTPPPVTP